MFKIFQIMNKLNQFSNLMEKSGLSPNYAKPKTNGKVIRKKQKSKKQRKKSKKQRKKSKKETVVKSEFLGGFDYKRIGDRMMGEI